MSEVGEALEADAIIQALGVFFPSLFGLGLSVMEALIKFLIFDKYVVNIIESVTIMKTKAVNALKGDTHYGEGFTKHFEHPLF